MTEIQILLTNWMNALAVPNRKGSKPIFFLVSDTGWLLWVARCPYFWWWWEAPLSLRALQTVFFNSSAMHWEWEPC